MVVFSCRAQIWKLGFGEISGGGGGFWGCFKSFRDFCLSRTFCRELFQVHGRSRAQGSKLALRDKERALGKLFSG